MNWPTYISELIRLFTLFQSKSDASWWIVWFMFQGDLLIFTGALKLDETVNRM